MIGAWEGHGQFVYILNGNFLDAFPANEDPVPFDSEPHPEHGPVVLGHNHLDPNWQNEHQGAAHNLGLFGGNPHPGQFHHHQVNQNQQNGQTQEQDNPEEADPMEEDENEDEWPAWNPAIFAADNGHHSSCSTAPWSPSRPH
jgi:hypothetical protein